MLQFADGTRVAIKGLGETLAELYAEDRPTNQETAEEILARLEARANFIPPGAAVRREYRYHLLKKYEEYVEYRHCKDHQD
ncbi:MAG: hypothetical protein M0R80_07150 [Proteobacteria bacterium]|jgi:hypothetical protein|nr:hypothetical protein [Pseudomonadota bacterium]